MSRIFQKTPFNYSYKVGVCNAVDYNLDQFTATGVVVNQVLGSVFLPGGAFVRDGQELYIRVMGRSGGAGSKSLRLQVNTQNLIAVSAITPTNNTSWLFETLLRRRSATSIYRSSRFFFNMGETAGPAAPTILGNGGIFTPGFDVGAVDLSFRLEVDVAVATETIRQDEMSIAIL